MKTTTVGSTTNTTLYLRGTAEYPIVEKTGTSATSTDKNYIYGPNGIIAIQETQGGGTAIAYFIIKDHLGSTRVVLNTSGTPQTWYDYTPYGTIWRSTVNKEVNYKFTGQEYDKEIGLHHFRARPYDDTLNIFYAVDKDTNKSLMLSPFLYAANNPLKYVDPSGDSVWVYYEDADGNNQRFIYTGKDMKTKGLSKEAANIVNMLNTVARTKLGGIALGKLVRSEENYNIYRGFPSATAEYVSNRNSTGGDIALSSKADWISLGHEIWHGFQDESRMSGSGIAHEVDAFTAGASMKYEVTGIIENFSNGTQEGAYYNIAMQGLLRSDGYQQGTFNNAVKNFKKGSANNDNGAYDNYGDKLGGRGSIEKYYPLINRR